MLLHAAPGVSTNEVETHDAAFRAGFRADGRKFEEPRSLVVELSTKPIATVRLGKTRVTAVSTAKVTVPSETSPSKGFHQIEVRSLGFLAREAAKELSGYFQMLWKQANIVDSESLCMRPGEKAWRVSTEIIIHDDDGGLIDAMFAACYASLYRLEFPFFDSVSGGLYPPSQRRTHRIAFAVRPISVTVGFLGNQLIADPSLIEMQAMNRFATFVFDEWNQQILFDGQSPGNVEQARIFARQIANGWRDSVSSALNAVKATLECVGDRADFIDYEPSKFKVPERKAGKELPEFKPWIGEVTDEFVLNFFKGLEPATPLDVMDSEVGNDKDWLFASLA